TAGVYSATWRRSASVISLASIVSSAITLLPFEGVPRHGPPGPLSSSFSSLTGRALPDAAEPSVLPITLDHVLLQPVQPSPDGGVQLQVADLHVDPGQQVGFDGDLQLHRGARQPGQRLLQRATLPVGDFLSGGHPGDPPAAGPGGLLGQPLQGADDVSRPAADDRVLDQSEGGRSHPVPQQVADDGPADGDWQVAIGQGAAEGGGGGDGAGEPEQLVLDLFQVGGGQVFEDRGGEPTDPPAGGDVAEDRLVDVATVGLQAGPVGQPSDGGR